MTIVRSRSVVDDVIQTVKSCDQKVVSAPEIFSSIVFLEYRSLSFLPLVAVCSLDKFYVKLWHVHRDVRAKEWDVRIESETSNEQTRRHHKVWNDVDHGVAEAEGLEAVELDEVQLELGKILEGHLVHSCGEDLCEVVGPAGGDEVTVRALRVLLVVGGDVEGHLRIRVGDPVESDTVEAVRLSLNLLELLPDLGH